MNELLGSRTRAAALGEGRSCPSTAPGDTHELGAFLSRLLDGAGRRALGALPARHLAFPAAAERGGGGVGRPRGGGAGLRVVRPRPGPIHLSPQLRGAAGWGTKGGGTASPPEGTCPPGPARSRRAGPTHGPTAAARGRCQHVQKLPPPRTAPRRPIRRGLANIATPTTRLFRAERSVIGCAAPPFGRSSPLAVLAAGL